MRALEKLVKIVVRCLAVLALVGLVGGVFTHVLFYVFYHNTNLLPTYLLIVSALSFWLFVIILVGHDIIVSRLEWWKSRKLQK